MRARSQDRQRWQIQKKSLVYWVRGLQQSNSPESEKVLAMFQPDTLIRDQFEATYLSKFRLPPEKFLMLAVLCDAVNCFQENFKATEKRRRQLFLEANEWIMDGNTNHLYSFDNVCLSLGFSPSYLRRGLKGWKEAMMKTRPTARVAG